MPKEKKCHLSLNTYLITLGRVNYEKSVTVRKIIKNSLKLDQAEYCILFCFKVTTNYGNIKKRTMCSSMFHIQAMRKTMTILEICERSFKWDLAGCSSFIRLEWRQLVKNLEIHCAIFIVYLYSNIKNKRIELEICSWRHFKEMDKE